ncbi:hypothetical protein PS723_00743 [Pseudomonas fluorescens]|uniref:O-antigen ligase-related domain-containing protein n=2 Tax=Pseudomonas fluorescens TaxID=294 RepID=A0A5E7AI35_PSEFL|nr:O-antigen ligase family protein [Pseudomonas fluorescens]VVN76284.1 hypothetical protein PS723_00743 [Pseudomonas fluorescens]
MTTTPSLKATHWGSAQAGKISTWLILYWLPIGWLALLSGMFWVGDRALYHKLYYLTLAAPTLIALLLEPQLLKQLLSSPLIKLFLLFSAYILISVQWSGTEETPLTMSKRPLYILMLLFAAMLITLRSPDRLDGMTRLAAILAVVCAAASLVYFFYCEEGGRFNGYGALYNPLLSSHVFGFFCAYWLSSWYLGSKPTALLPLIAMAILWALLIFTGSRTPIMAMFGCLLWMAIAQWKHRLWLVIAVAIALVVAVQSLPQSEDLMVRGVSFRPAIWAEALRQIQASPWIGLGFTHPQVFWIEGFPYALADPHNIELGVLFEGGVIGLTLWLMMYAYAMFYAWQRRDQPCVLIASTLVVYGFMAGLTEGSAFFSRPKEHWFLIWIPLALLAATRFSARQQAEEQLPLNRPENRPPA